MHKHREKQKYLHAHNHFESLHHGAMYRQRLMNVKKSFVSVHRMRDKMYLEFLKALGNAHIDPRMSKFLLGRVHSEGFHGTANGKLQQIMANTLQELQSTPVLAMHIMYGGELTHMALVNRLHDTEEKTVDSEPPQSRGVVNDVYQRLQGYLTQQAQGDAAPPNFTADDIKVIDKIHGATTGVVSPLASQPLTFPIPGPINKMLDTLSPVTKAISDIYHGANVIDTITSAASGELNKLGSIFKGFRSADHLMDVEAMGAGVVAATVGAPEVAVLGAAYATALGFVDALGASGYDTYGLADESSTVTGISDYLNDLSDFSAGRYSRYSQDSTVPVTGAHGRRLLGLPTNKFRVSGAARTTIGAGRSRLTHDYTELKHQADAYQDRLSTLLALGGFPNDLSPGEKNLAKYPDGTEGHPLMVRKSRFYRNKIIELNELILAQSLGAAKLQAAVYQDRLSTLQGLGGTPPGLTTTEEDLATTPDETTSLVILQKKSRFYHDEILKLNALIADKRAASTASEGVASTASEGAASAGGQAGASASTSASASASASAPASTSASASSSTSGARGEASCAEQVRVAEKEAEDARNELASVKAAAKAASDAAAVAATGAATGARDAAAELASVKAAAKAASDAAIAAATAASVASDAAIATATGERDDARTSVTTLTGERDDANNKLAVYRAAEIDSRPLSNVLSSADPKGDTQHNMATYASLISQTTGYLKDWKKMTPEVRRRAVDKIRYWMSQMHDEEKKAVVGTPSDMSTKVAGVLQGALQEHVQGNKGNSGNTGNDNTSVSSSESLNAPSDVMNKLSSLLNSLAGGATQLLMSTPDGVKTPAQFAGPGTDVVNMLKSGVMGVTLADTCARAHDIELMLAQSRGEEEMADINIQNNLLKVAQSDMDSMYNTMLVSTITEMKKFFDNQVKDTGSHTLSRKDRAFLTSELDKTHHYIHRHVNPYRRHGKRGVQ